MAEAGRIVAETLRWGRRAVPASHGRLTRSRGIHSAAIRAPGRPSRACTTSPRPLHLHQSRDRARIPSRRRILRDGDLVSVDCGVCVEVLHGDSAVTVRWGGHRGTPRSCCASPRRRWMPGPPAVYRQHVGESVRGATGCGGCRLQRGPRAGGSWHRYQLPRRAQVPNFGNPSADRASWRA